MQESIAWQSASPSQAGVAHSPPNAFATQASQAAVESAPAAQSDPQSGMQAAWQAHVSPSLL
jgi:hypothetical protein